MSTMTQLTTVPSEQLLGSQALRPQQPAANEPQPAARPATPAANPDTRLVIQEGTMAGLFIYTILDRASGQVMAQIPREDVQQLAARPDYEAGQVVDTKV